MVPASASFQYQLQYNLDRAAKALHLPWTQAGLADAAVQAATATRSPKATAYALEELAVDQVAIGEDAQASRSFERADRELATLGQGPGTTHYLADWQTDRAQLDAKEQKPGAALQTLSAQEAAYEKLDTMEPRIRFYTEYSELLRKSNRPQESIEKARTAVSDAERMLPSIRTEQERSAWIESASPAYRVLTLALVDTGQTGSALQTWEGFRIAPFRADRKLLSSTQASNDSTFPSIPTQAAGSLTVVLARVQDRYIAWSINDDPREPIRFRTLSAPASAIESQARAFDRLCEDPHSSQQDIALLGVALYKRLIGPFQDQVDRAQRIQLDLDPSLSRISFAALKHNGHFFGLEHPLIFLTPWWTLSSSVNEKPAATQERLPEHPRLLVVRESSSDPAARIPEEYDESKDIVARFPQAQTESASLHRSGSTLTVYGAPVLKSVLADADLVHYSGHGLDEDSTGQAQAEPGGQTPVQLDPGVLRHCSLAVLSACRTLGEREDAVEDDPSFERIVLSSGASHVIGAQWDVDSAMTRKLMVRFYTELADHQTFAEALRRAQQELQSDPVSSHPYFWSAFQLVGQ
jgi:CHAT domain-containing protein